MILSARTTGQGWHLNFGPSFKTIYDERNKGYNYRFADVCQFAGTTA